MRTEEYYNLLKEYRDGIREIRSFADSEKQKLEKFKGGLGYADEIKKIEESATEAVNALQAKCRSEGHKIIEGMRSSAENRSLVAPTQEQLQILEVLKMRKPENLKREEIRQIARSLEGCPLALSVLGDICNDAGLSVSVKGKASTADILSGIDAMEKFMDTTFRMNRVDNIIGWNASPQYGNVEYPIGMQGAFIRADKDFSDVRSCVSYTSNVADYDSFTEAVNG